MLLLKNKLDDKNVNSNNILCLNGLLHLVLQFTSVLFCHLILFFVQDYREQHPNVVVLDSSEGIQRVHNRLSMLKDVSDLNFSDSCGKSLLSCKDKPNTCHFIFTFTSNIVYRVDKNKKNYL